MLLRFTGDKSLTLSLLHDSEPLLVKLSGKATVDGGVLRTTADLSKEITRNEVLEIGGTKERVDCRRKNGQEGAIAVSLRSIKSGEMEKHLVAVGQSPYDDVDRRRMVSGTVSV